MHAQYVASKFPRRLNRRRRRRFKQAVSGLGLGAQRATIADYAARKGLTVVAK